MTWELQFRAYVQPTTLVDAAKKPAFGFALIHLGDPDQLLTSQYTMVEDNGQYYLVDDNGNRVNYDAIPKESNNSFAGFGSFAIETGAGSIGGTLKLIYQDFIAGESSMGIGIDLGYLHRDFLTPNLAVGAKLQDATGTYLSWSTGTNEYIVPSLCWSAHKINLALNGSALPAVDADIFFDDRQIAPHLVGDEHRRARRFGAQLPRQSDDPGRTRRGEPDRGGRVVLRDLRIRLRVPAPRRLRVDAPRVSAGQFLEPRAPPTRCCAVCTTSRPP
jgi:hypothetical protein